MAENRLNIVAVENGKTDSLQKKRRDEAKTKFEHLWQTDPEKFNPLRNCMERERVKRTWKLITSSFSPANKEIADLGCGDGYFAHRLCEYHAKVVAVDIASNALKIVEKKKMKNLSTLQNYVPRTILKEDHYDMIISTELIANLPSDEFRLYFSELARIVKPDGFVLCSTALDIASEDALQRFASLAETEFKIEKWIFSYHFLYIKFHDCLIAPSRFIKANRDSEYRHQQLHERSALNRWWFNVNSTAIPVACWCFVNIIMKPFVKFYQQSPLVLNVLEKISRAIWNERAISHAIFLGTRRPLVTHVPEADQPIERKQKRQVWE